MSRSPQRQHQQPFPHNNTLAIRRWAKAFICQMKSTRFLFCAVAERRSLLFKRDLWTNVRRTSRLYEIRLRKVSIIEKHRLKRSEIEALNIEHCKISKCTSLRIFYDSSCDNGRSSNLKTNLISTLRLISGTASDWVTDLENTSGEQFKERFVIFDHQHWEHNLIVQKKRFGSC